MKNKLIRNNILALVLTSIVSIFNSCNQSDSNFDIDDSDIPNSSATIYPSITEAMATNINFLKVDFDAEYVLNVLNVVATEKADGSSGYNYSYEKTDITAENLSKLENLGYDWEFGDGKSSSEASPSHTYTEAGEYEVILTLSYAGETYSNNDAGYEENVYIFTVEVEEPPISFDTVSLFNGGVLFTNTTLDVSDFTYSWDFGDGTTDVGTDVSHVYPNDDGIDEYSVTVTATSIADPSYTEDFTQDVMIVSPVASFTYFLDVGTTVANFQTVLGDDNFNYDWDFGDNVGTSTESLPVYDYLVDGTYTVLLTVTDLLGTTSTYSEDVEVSSSSVVIPTFPAVILNGDFETYTYKSTDIGGGVIVDNDQDNADAFSLTPSGTVILDDGSEVASPYTWSNSDLKASVLLACDDTSTTGGVTSDEYEGNWAIKLGEVNRRLYQPFTVEAGVTYTISLYVKKEAANTLNLYILNNLISDESNLSGNSDVEYPISDADNTYNLHTFQFTASTNTAVFYAVPTFIGAPDNGNCEYKLQEIFLDNISIATPGF